MDTSDFNKEKLEQKYDLYAKKFREFYLAGKERGREGMDKAMHKAREELVGLGELTVKQGDQLTEYLSRDLDQTIDDMYRLGDEARVYLDPGRLGAGALASLVSIMEFTSEFLSSVARKSKNALTYRTGEITSAGTLTCRTCGQQMHLKKSGHVPPCPKCSGTVFDKSY